MSTAYEELVERCARAICKARGRDPDSPRWVSYPGGATSGICWHENIESAQASVAEVFRTLKNVTPEMDRAASGALQSYINGLTDEERAESGARKKGGCFVGPKTKHRERYFAMLRASPLAPAKEGK